MNFSKKKEKKTYKMNPFLKLAYSLNFNFYIYNIYFFISSLINKINKMVLE